MKNKIDVEAIVSKYKNDSTRLVKELNKLIKEGQKTGDILLIGSTYYHLCIAYYNNSEWDNMFVNAIKAVTYLDKTDAYELQARAHIALSFAYEEQENTLMSFEECDKAYQILKKHKSNTTLKIIALNNLATCYHEMKDVKTAIKMIDECIELVKRDCPDDLENLAMVIINKANFIEESNELIKAKEILESISTWINEVEFKPLVADYYLRLASNAYARNDVEEGRKIALLGIESAPDDEYPLPLYEDFREVGHLAILNKQLDVTQKIFDIMKVFEVKSKGAVEETLSYRFMADYYQGMGEYQKAAQYYVKLDEIYEKRMKEQKGSQCKAYTKMKLADLERNRIYKKMKEKELLASKEPLTGLLSRSALLDVSTEYINLAYKKKQKIGAIFVDIDFFKECNDTYGHTRGDEIIKLVAEICRQEEGSNIRFARYGGDEFFGITHGLQDNQVLDIAKRICSNINSRAIPNEHSPYKVLTLSVGVINVSVKDNTKTIIDMVKYADKAMYHAKNDGKNAIYRLDYGVDNDFLFKKIEY